MKNRDSQQQHILEVEYNNDRLTGLPLVGCWILLVGVCAVFWYGLFTLLLKLLA